MRKTPNAVFGLTLLIAVALLGWRFWPSGPPAIEPADVSSFDPDLAQLISKAVNAANARRNSAEMRSQLGKVYEANSLHALAEATYLQALDIDPKDGRIWFRYAICLEREGDLEAAVTAMNSCIELEPAYAAARWRQAIWLADLGRLDQAAERIKEALELDPDEYAWMASAKVLVAQQQNAEAIELIESRQLENGVNRNFARFLKGTAYRQLGQPEMASSLLAELDNAKPVWRDAWSRDLQKFQTGLAHQRAVASGLIKKGRFEQAISPLNQILEREPTDYRSWNLLGYALLNVQHGDEAINAFRQAVKHSPAHFGSKQNLVRAMLRNPTSSQADMQEALRQAGQALKMRPNSTTAMANLALVHVQLRDLRRARELFDAAAQIEDDPELAAQAGFLEIRLGEWARAKQRFEGLPPTANVLLGKAAIAAHDGDRLATETLLKNSLAAGSPDASMLKYMHELLKQRSSGQGDVE